LLNKFSIGNVNKSNKKIAEDELEDFDTYLKKMMLPKSLRKINPNLLKLIPRATGGGKGEDLEQAIEPTEKQKELIRMKWNLKRMQTEQN